MTATEINRRVAEALGWANIRYTTDGWVANWTIRGMTSVTLPDFATDPAAADLVRQEIERRGWRYFIQRWDSHWDMEIYHNDFPDVFVQSHTSYYELLCLAFLAAVEATDNTPRPQSEEPLAPS